MNINSTEEDSSSISVPIENQITFYIFLFLEIPSIFCSLILMYYFFRLRNDHREEYSNHMTYYLLVGSFVTTSLDISLLLPYYQNHFYIYSMKYSIEFCMFWTILDFGMYSFNLWLMALACFEYYLRIFFKQILMKTKTRCILLYYVSVTLAFICSIVWFLYAVVFFPCDPNVFDFTQPLCGSPCYAYDANTAIQTMDWTLSALLPLFLAIVFIILLIIHVFYQKHKMKRRLLSLRTWRTTRKLFLTLLPIIFIFLIFNMPLIIVGLLSISDPWLNSTLYFYTNTLYYGLPLCMPFAIFSRQNSIRRKLSILLRLRWFNCNRIVPGPTTAHT